MHVAKTARFAVFDLGAPVAAKPAGPKPSTSTSVPTTPAAMDADALAAAVTKQQSELKMLKKAGAAPEEVAAAAAVLDKLRVSLAAAEAGKEPTATFNRKGWSRKLLEPV